MSEFRDRFGTGCGDEVLIHEEDGKLVIEPSFSRDELAEGYWLRSQASRELADELAGVSKEAIEYVGEPPKW